VGAKDWMLAFCEKDARAVLRGGPSLERARARIVAERLLPGCTLAEIEDGTLGENANPRDDLIYVGTFDGLTLVCTGLAALDCPSQLPHRLLTAVPSSRVYLHAMHSVVDWFAYAVWIDGALHRALSLAPDPGILENIGTPWAFEEPYWNGERPVFDPQDLDPDEEPYPFAFHPLEFAESALQELLGITFEGTARPEDVDPMEIPLAGFRIIRG